MSNGDQNVPIVAHNGKTKTEAGIINVCKRFPSIPFSSMFSVLCCCLSRTPSHAFENPFECLGGKGSKRLCLHVRVVLIKCLRLFLMDNSVKWMPLKL